METTAARKERAAPVAGEEIVDHPVMSAEAIHTRGLPS
jgi:hypothetical protein